ncbi:hypothetical protein FSARC_10756 [Fusarium sarcochroum]|uniref:Uncharacterized protein n=1 Tax=Fusarium sarcochroum TaxID=1208366 RepID=A0A8H4TJW6_9HYPO|nr:hypothetical protein FSARC_10756 [Fusarium sarcochroum]
MPTATEYFGFSAHNLGPLTTTFTAPSSCATNTNRIVYANASSASGAYGGPTCNFKPIGDCIPSGKSWDSLSEQTTKFIQGRHAYFSPGVVCPQDGKLTYFTDAWLTYSAIAKDLVVATHMPALSLIYKESDLDKKVESDDDKSGEDGGNSAESEKTDENAASTTAPRQGVVDERFK